MVDFYYPFFLLAEINHIGLFPVQDISNWISDPWLKISLTKIEILGFLYQDFPLLFPNAQLCHERNATDTADKLSPEPTDFSPFPLIAQFLLKLPSVLPLHPLGHSEAYDLFPGLCLAVPALSNHIHASLLMLTCSIPASLKQHPVQSTSTQSTLQS